MTPRQSATAMIVERRLGLRIVYFISLRRLHSHMNPDRG